MCGWEGGEELFNTSTRYYISIYFIRIFNMTFSVWVLSQYPFSWSTLLMEYSDHFPFHSKQVFSSTDS